PEQVHAADRAPLDRRRRQHRLVGAALGVGHLADPDGDPLRHLPATDHERRHQLRPEGLITLSVTDPMADLVETWWDAAAQEPSLGHRALMRLVATAVALEVARPEASSPTRLTGAVGLADRLVALQGPDGLFSSDGNLHSPPDSAFTL